MSSPARSRLQKEIQQRVPFESIQGEALLSILHTADVVRRRTAQILEPFGVTPQQYNVLRILRGAGSSGLPTLEIAERMIEQAPGITRMIDRLELKKMVARERGCDDRRLVLCRITPVGLDLLCKLDAPLRDHAASGVGAANEHELKALLAVLDKIRVAPER
jgi:DNA-binding MarR family transcriptional regulator